MTDQNLLDKSMRSVFVGNIPYEATEEKLKDIFNEVGPVLSFKLVYDRETGKPKGYGFCEYKDQETALSAMRNLNGYEIGGRMLRVDNACTEKSRLEMQSLMQGPQVDNQYGEPVAAEKAPEAISKAVASLPPEQMFELMKQMKLCVQNNPNEARNMLLQNPQLAYALLQAQVVMRIVDPNVAVTMLHKTNPVPVPLAAADSGGIRTTVAPPVRPEFTSESQWNSSPAVTATAPGVTPVVSRPIQAPAVVTRELNSTATSQPFGVSTQDMDMRSLPTIDPRMGRMGDQDMRMPPSAPLPNMAPLRDSYPPPVDHFGRDPRGPIAPDRFQRDPRAGMVPVPPAPVPRPVAPPIPPQPVAPPASMQQQPRLPAGIPSGATDQEKAALIMQVLQLSDEQISMLPPEQRQSILVLKEQIAKSTQR
ncbi:cleavage stimulation factor subunit 2 CstF64 [Lycorma delicatula]|uniref:cleavage stimulation factor subunit 2 CstF64 n=1 Tax=Lycorma delicatula TaxID=130591 RepID=UPI003F519010